MHYYLLSLPPSPPPFPPFLPPFTRYFTVDFSGYLTLSDGSSWSPTQQYYCKLISRLVKGEAACTEENILYYNNLLLIFPSLLLFLRSSTVQLFGSGVRLAVQ